MTGPGGGPTPDLDQVIDAFVRLIEAATYADAVRRADEIAIRSAYRDRAAGADDLRIAVVEAEAQARTALYDTLDHQRSVRLIPRVSAARYEAAARAEAAYEALPAERPDDDGTAR